MPDHTLPPSRSLSPSRSPSPSRQLLPLAVALVVCAATLAGCASAPDLAVATGALTAEPSFGSNPGHLAMYAYVPPSMPPAAPLVVALHGCSQTADAYVAAGWNELADRARFYVVYAEQPTSANGGCFDWWDAADITRDGAEPTSIVQMVDAMKTKYSIDASRVFVTGLSAGGAMTSVLAAAYPDVFAGGAIMSGIPYGCATTQTQAYACMSGSVSQSAQAWGDLVRKAAPPGFDGPWPRLSMWQGDADYTVRPANEAALASQWSDLHGATLTKMETVAGAAHTVYTDGSGDAAVESWLIPGMGHGTALEVGFAPAGGCGQAGAFMLDVGICSTWYAASFFGLVGPAAAGGSDGGAGSGGGNGVGGAQGPRGCGCAIGGAPARTPTAPLVGFVLAVVAVAAARSLTRRRRA